MGFNEFWLQFNNGKKEQLNDTKHGVRKEQVDKKFHNLFDAYDTNNDGVLEENEAKIIYAQLKEFAGDNVFDSEENLKTMSLFAEQANIENVDYQGFIKSISDAAANIISFKENVTDDGGKEITTEYKDGTKQTIAYYQNGDFKWKKTEKKYKKTVYEIVLNGERREVTEEQFKKAQQKVKESEKQSGQISAQKGKEGQKSLSVSAPAPDIQGYSTTKKWEEKTQEFSPRFIAENLGVDINSQEGKKILERMSYLPKEALDQIKDGTELKDILVQNDLSADFNNISNILEILYGVTIRNDVELKESEEQRKQLLSQIQTVGIMSELYARVAEFNDNYTDSQGLFGMGSEGIGYILNKIGIQGENHYQWADSCREFIEKINDFKVLNPAKFEQEFKELTGKEKFNVEALQKMVELAKDGKAQDEYGDYTDEYKQAVKEFSNFDVTNINARAWYHPDNLISGFGEALIMIGTLGYGAETKAGQMLATSTMATFSKAGVAVASKQVNNRLLQGALRISGKGIKLIGPALNEGTKMYAYTAVMGTATNIANRAIKFNSEENTLDKFLQTEAMVLDNAKGSFGFGAFAGVFGSTVTQKVMQRASRVSTKVGTALSDKFAKGAVDANEVFTTILEKSAPTKIAEVAALATDVLGFTAFESVLAIIKNLDNFPDGYSVEDLTNIIWEELKSQGYNLGQIKIVAWLMSSRNARMQATRYMRDAIPQLRGATVEWVNEGKDGYKINLPDGRKVECKNTTEYISALHLMVRGETAFNSKFDIKNPIAKIKSKNTEKNSNSSDSEYSFDEKKVSASEEIQEGEKTVSNLLKTQNLKELKETFGKDFSAVQMKIINEYLLNDFEEIIPEHMTIIEKMLNTKSLTPDEIIKLIKSEKIPQDELFKIDEYAKVAEEQGFNIVQMMESSEQEFNTYIEQESQRIAEGKIKVNEPETKITVTDNKSSLLEQIKNKFKYYNLKEAKEELKSLTKEEVQKLSELLASDKYLNDRLGRYYELKDYVRIVKNAGDADLELAKECLKNGFHLNFYHGLADVIDNNSARREVAFELLKLNSQFKQVKQHSAYQYQSNIVADEAYWNYILKDIKTEGQKDAYLLYLKSVRLEEISDHSAIQPNMRYINNVDEMQAWLEIKDYKRSYHREEFRQTYLKLSPEDRKLFTKEQFDYENQWDSGFGRLIDVMKLLLDPNIKSGYKEEIREFLKKNPDDMMTFKIMRAIDSSGKKTVFNIEHFRRIARFANTGVKYDDYQFKDLTEGYLNKDGVFEYAYDNAYLDRWYEALTNGAEEKTLGRRFTMEEAQSVSYVREDWKKDFVIKHLKEGMREFDISNLCQDVNCNVQTEEQLRIAEILREYKNGIQTQEGEPIDFHCDIYKCVTTKEDIDAFCRIFGNGLLPKKQAELYAKFVSYNFAKNVQLMESTLNLTRIISDLDYGYMKIEDLYKKTNEFGQQAMLLLDKFVEVHPEMSDKIKSFLSTNSGDYECTLTKIKSQETVERIEKNLYKIDNMSPEDIEILKEILADELNWSDQTSFSGLITDCDFSIEKFDILKPLYLRERAKGDLYGYDKNNYRKLLAKDYDIEILKKIVECSSNISEVDNAIYALDCCDHELVKTLLFDTDFELDMIKDVVQQDINHFDRQDNTIEQVKHLAKTYKQKKISRNEAYVMMLNIREITQEMAQKMLAKAEKAEIEHTEINRKINPQKDYQPSEKHMLSYARAMSDLINESNRELIKTFLNDDYFTPKMIETICKKQYVFEEMNRWSPEKDMEKALDVAKNYKQKGMTPEEAYVMLLNIPAMTKTLAQRIITRVRAEETENAQKENRELKESVIEEQIVKSARDVCPETTELAELLYTDENLNVNKINDIINFKNDGYNSLSAVPQIMEIAKTYKQKGIDKSVAYLMMLNPFSITERMAKKVLKQVRDEIEESKSLSSLLPNHKSRATDISRYEREGEMLVRYISADRAELAEYLLDTPEWSDRTRKIKNVLENTKNAHEVLDLCKNYEKYELTQEQAIQVIESRGEISARDLSKLNKLMGRKTVMEMTPTDRNTAVRFVDVIDVQNINEITIGGKKKLLRALVDNKDGSFQISDKLRERLPIVPRNVDEYCPLLRSIVRAIGIETEALTPEQRLQMFNSSMKDLSKSLAELSDKDFADLKITLEQPREEFIEIVKEKIKGLSDLEKRKVFDYYGFELHRNKNNSTGYTITGYPVNLNNGQKLALIENPKTKAVVEALRPDVIKFSKQNRIKCSNSQIEQFLNEVLDGLPEIRTMIGKSQHGSHDFDVMQHSLKVMQKLVQDPKFEKLSESDKKIMLLASLLHDITKGEGYSDRTHATESSFDAFYIAQKFKLSRDDVLKLYTLIEQHEWLGNVNTKRGEEALTKALQRTAFNLQNDNLFELALMFTHADLKAVRKDNSFHDKTEGPSRINFRGEVHSFGEAADIHAQRIREYVKELKANKPFTPTTRIPKASAIKSRIGSVDPDGKARDKSGNIINGLYLRESDGLVIIKHNEVTDWEAIGFSKGTTSKGIKGIGKIRNKHETKGSDIDEAPYETGNVHYFMHGLDYPNQLMKFEAFTQPDSRAMISVTYLERPESKPRGFRPQGIFLRFLEKYVYGGGETDAGSGCGKSVDDFVEQYCFGGPREKDRTMVSELHKKSTGMSDEEYVRFIEENQNKEWTGIDPVIGNKMIKGLGDGIISTGRRHDRAYDEFYASNPEEVEATFAYEENVDLTIDNPIEFVNKNEYRLNYLIRFNHDHDIPMILMGD